jgi:hypothetical protein
MSDIVPVTQIEAELSKKNNQEMYDLMWDALDNMQAYNGRSKFTCIAMAMGYECYEENNGKMIYKES